MSEISFNEKFNPVLRAIESLKSTVHPEDMTLGIISILAAAIVTSMPDHESFVKTSALLHEILQTSWERKESRSKLN